MKIFSKICLINAILFCSACQTIKGVDNDRQALVKTLNVFRAKTPNYVYDTLGEPDDYQVEVDKNNDVVKGIITYILLNTVESDEKFEQLIESFAENDKKVARESRKLRGKKIKPEKPKKSRSYVAGSLNNP